MSGEPLHSRCSRPAADERLRVAAVAILLLVAVCAVFGRSAGHDFVNFDDDQYVYNNQYIVQGVTLKGISWAMTATHAANWHPLTWLSHMLDVQLFGLDPAGHHLMNVALHGANGILLLLLLWRLSGALWPSATVALLFALHPLHVESVAWVAERKDLLSTMFGLLTIHCYTSAVRSGRRSLYVATSACYILGLMAKPMLVSLPLLLLLLDYWPLGRFGSIGKKGWGSALGPLLREKTPLLLAMAGSALVTIHAQSRGGAISSLADTPATARIANALVSCGQYLAKTFWPKGLAVFYPFPAKIQYWQAGIAFTALSLITWGVLRFRRERPWLLTGWFWYLCSLLPVIGIISVGSQAMADRYTYLPLNGIFIMVVWLTHELLPKGSAWRISLPVTVAAICSLLAWQQLGYWQNSVTLNRRALAVTSANFIAEHNLGLALDKEGDYTEALQHFSEATRIAPWFAKNYVSMAETLRKTGRVDEGLAMAKTALQVYPGFDLALDEIGLLLLETGRAGEALAVYREMLAAGPKSATLLLKIGIAAERTGDHTTAIDAFRSSLAIDPHNADCRFNLAVALDNAGHHGEAAAEFDGALRAAPRPAVLLARRGAYLRSRGNFAAAEEVLQMAIRQDPGLAAPRTEMALLMLQQQRPDEALAYLREALRLDPALPDSHYNIGLIYANRGDHTNARQHLKAAVRLRPAEADYRFNLGLELARQKQFSEAAAEFAEVVRLHPAGDLARLARIQLEQSGRQNSRSDR